MPTVGTGAIRTDRPVAVGHTWTKPSASEPPASLSFS